MNDMTNPNITYTYRNGAYIITSTMPHATEQIALTSSQAQELILFVLAHALDKVKS